jgi:hypothetical protein
VVVVGDPAMQGKVRAQVAQWITQHGYALAAKAMSADGQKTLTNCFVIEDTSCARAVYARQVKADFLVYVRVDLTSSKDKAVDLAGYWFVKDRDPAVDKRACKPCTNSALNQAVGDQMSALLEAAAIAKAHLRVSKPPGLVVLLDGTELGVTPVEEDVAAGAHTVALTRDGKELGSMQIEAKAGETADVVIPIKSDVPTTTPVPTDPKKEPTTTPEKPPVQPPPPPPPPVKPSRIVPGLLIVGGLSAIAVGGVFVYYGQKNGVNDPVIYPNATKEGAIIAGVGGVALITGLVWWWRGSSTSGPTVAVTSSDTMIGWAGRF